MSKLRTLQKLIYKVFESFGKGEINLGKAIDEKQLGIQEIKKLKYQLDLANDEIRKIKKDMELLKRAININNEDVKNEDLKIKSDSKIGLNFVIEDEEAKECVEKEEITNKNNEVIEFELSKEPKEKTEIKSNITIEEIDDEIQLSLKKISGEIEKELKNIANEIAKEDDLKKELKENNKDKKISESKKDEDLNDSEILYKNTNITKNIEENDIEENDNESLNLLKNIKNSFIENNNYECILTLNKIIENIDDIEKYLTLKDIIMLMYLGYFYEKLNDLLEKSKKINDFYISENEESKLLRCIILERDFPINKDSSSCVEEMLNNKKLFYSLETIVKGNIIEKIRHIIYKTFDGVYSIKDIVRGEDIVTIKAWVKKKDNLMWILVEGLYSNDTNKLYMLESAISILHLNYKKEEKINYNNIESSISIKPIKKTEFKENIKTEDSINDHDENKEVKEQEAIIYDKKESFYDEEVSDFDKKDDAFDNEDDNGWKGLKNKIFSKFKKNNKE